MKKKIIIIIVTIVCLVLLIKEPTKQEIRTRIIPNSNNELDLLVKEEIKEIVIDFLQVNYNKNENEYINNINYNLDYLREEVIKIEENVKIELTKHTFYNKTYNGNSIKNEEVLTLLVTINEGKGDNWWGSIYPEFLEVQSDEVVEYKSFFRELLERLKG